MKPQFKKIIYQLGLSGILDQALYKWSRFHHAKKNKLFLDQFPEVVLPPDYFLYETFQLDYQKFMEDGKLAATEIIEWSKPYLKKEDPNILDFGCGVGRIIRHLPAIIPNAKMGGCDINNEMIDWDRKNYSDLHFSLIEKEYTLPYTTEQFQLIYAFSVFTHIPVDEVSKWISELSRVISPMGILLITTHGEKFNDKLSKNDLSILQREGSFTQSYFRKGHRMMTSYWKKEDFKKILEPNFNILEYYAGTAFPQKAGGQDLWILQKKSAE